MRAAASLLLKLVCSLTLLFSALPSRTGVVCVEQGRVVGLCSMVSIPEPAVPQAVEKAPAMARMACCRAKASKAKTIAPCADACPTHRNTRCAYAYRSGLVAVSPVKARRVDAALALDAVALPVALVLVYNEVLVGAGGGTFAGDSDPPRSRPRQPDRGRAPPVV